MCKICIPSHLPLSPFSILQVGGIKYIHIVVQPAIPTTLSSSQTKILETSSTLAGLPVLTAARPPPGQRFWGSLLTWAAPPFPGFFQRRTCWGRAGTSSPKSGCPVIEDGGQAPRSWQPHPHSRAVGSPPQHSDLRTLPLLDLRPAHARSLPIRTAEFNKQQQQKNPERQR